MLLGKRPRLPIKRTASMSGIRLDLGDVELEEPSDHDLQYVAQNSTMFPQNYSALVSPRLLRNQSPDHFLRTCGLCKRRLSPGLDIYMYRGDTAFCSSECREKQIKQDERKEEYSSVGSKNKDDRRAASSSTKGSRGSRKTQTVAAA